MIGTSPITFMRFEMLCGALDHCEVLILLHLRDPEASPYQRIFSTSSTKDSISTTPRSLCHLLPIRLEPPLPIDRLQKAETIALHKLLHELCDITPSEGSDDKRL